MYDPASGDREERRIGPAEVVDYFGLGADKVVDIQALAGDSTDNVPGAPGIGVKTAAQLIGEYGDLETLLARAHEIKQPKRREALTLPENVERIRISKSLVTLVRDVPLETPLEALATPTLEGKELIAFFKAMELTTIMRRVAEMTGIEASSVEPDPRFVGPAGWQGKAGEEALAREQAAAAAAPPAEDASAPGAPTPADLVAKRLAEAQAPINRSAYRLLRSAKRGRNLDRAAPSTRASSPSMSRPRRRIRCRPISSDCRSRLSEGEAAYVPIGHRNASDDLFDGSGLLPEQIPEDEALALLKPLMEAPGVVKIGQNVKFDMQVLARRGVTVAPIDDTMLMSYALDAGATGESHDMHRLAERILGQKLTAFADVVGSGRNFIGFARAPLDRGGRIRLRKGRCRAAALARAQTPACRRACDDRLRDAGAAPGSGTGEDGAARHRHRPRHALASRRRLCSEHGSARGRDQPNRRRAVQPWLAETARRHSVRPDGSAGRKAHGDRRLVHNGERARGSRRRGPSIAGAGCSRGGRSPS